MYELIIYIEEGKLVKILKNPNIDKIKTNNKI